MTTGPLQVVRGTFDEVNRDRYGGALDWNSNRDKARAGAQYYKQQLDKYGERALALAAYFIGPAKADGGWAAPATRGLAQPQERRRRRLVGQRHLAVGLRWLGRWLGCPFGG